MRKILFIAPPFYEYPKLIRKEFERRGYVVDYFKSYPTGLLYKLADFLHLTRCQRLLIDKFNSKTLGDLQGNYSCVFIIKASILGSDFLTKLRHNVTAPFVQYIWDDLKFDKGARNTFAFFDKILSYNPQDCQNEGLILRTNFFIPSEHQINKDIDLLFVASYKPNRLEFIKSILPEVRRNNFICSINMKCSILLFILTPRLWKYRQYLVFRPIKYDKMMDLLGRSRAVIDVSEKNQKGLTTRPFEALGVGAKIITTNKDIVNYDFYHNNNISIVNEDVPLINKQWLVFPYHQVPEHILSKYSVAAFVDDILN